LAIIEAMKIMNELEAEFDCKILEVLVKDGQVVEYDTPLFRVERI
jgi:acetyl-CoA carboxylase biotin carboxyl carrier protein